MANRQQILEKLQAYVKKIQETEYATSSVEEQNAYESRLEVACEELTERVRQETSALEQVNLATKALLHRLHKRSSEPELEPMLSPSPLQTPKRASASSTSSQPPTRTSPPPHPISLTRTPPYQP